jgi:hypothetical protein
MKTFELPGVTECTCDHVNIREENHGEDKVLAVDLSFSKEGGNELLDLFDDALRTTLYYNAAATAGQEHLPEVLANLPNLRLPGLPERMHFGGTDKHGGYRATIDYGLGPDRSNVDLTDCAIGKKWIECKEGGTVRIGWRVSYSGEALQDVMVRGTLAGLKGQGAFIQLNAPAVLQLIKGGKHKAKVSEPGAEPDLLEGEEGELDPESPEGALAATAG